jgi:hypothetical protein
MGTTSFLTSEVNYFHITHDLTLALARPLSNLNPDMTLCYVSGMGTDSTEKGRIMWTRIKGATENRLLALPFKRAYMFRPGYIQPTKGLKNTYKIYRMASPFYPLWKLLMPNRVATLREIGLAMINSVNKGPDNRVLEVPDIVALAKE